MYSVFGVGTQLSDAPAAATEGGFGHPEESLQVCLVSSHIRKETKEELYPPDYATMGPAGQGRETADLRLGSFREG